MTSIFSIFEPLSKILVALLNESVTVLQGFQQSPVAKCCGVVDDHDT